ncbi:MAG: hypothetical protein LBM08_12450 [Dysgonamonadaceae bacterium]|jgi:hypothetical protein|nr:hypothetical protein [Dysgonamonadaceae bacterium]
MSYTRRYHEVVSKTVTVNYSYPASEYGGSGSESVSVDIPVDVNIDVDTNPFDRSVANCNSSVNLLTGAVVATEAAQIASIDTNAQKVGKTIVDGFFKTIRSEISQQIMELSTQLDATLMHLHKLGKRCVEKQKQMESDYNRIADRYIKVFADLNNELENRIFALDEPAFNFKRGSDQHSLRTLGSDLASTVSVFGREGGELQARLSASIAKKRAFDTIGKANTFLVKQKRLNDTINQSMLKESIAAIRYSPVCFVETQNEKNQIDKNVYQADLLPQMQANALMADFQAQHWSGISAESKTQIGRYFNAELNNRYNSADAHTNRVRENITKLLNFNQIKSV